MPSDWLATAQEDIRQAEYNISWQEQTYLPEVPAAYQAPNRAHNLRTYFTPDGVTVIPRTWKSEGSLPPWRMELALSAWGRAGAMSPAPPVVLPAVDGGGEVNRIEYQRGQLTEWYRNDENGLEQGFTLYSPPPAYGEAPVQLDLAIQGDLIPQLSADGTTIELQVRRSPGGAALLVRLAVVDAVGKSLPSYLSLDEEQPYRW